VLLIFTSGEFLDSGPELAHEIPMEPVTRTFIGSGFSLEIALEEGRFRIDHQMLARSGETDHKIRPEGLACVTRQFFLLLEVDTLDEVTLTKDVPEHQLSPASSHTL